MGNFLLTFFFPAVWEVVHARQQQQQSVLDVATSNVLALNGAANAATYGFWMLHAKWLQDRAANGSSIGAVEDILIDRYFDFSTLTADDLACQAQEQAIFAVAEARRLRQ